MKIVIYTCVTGGYDKLKTPCAVNDKFDYIYLSDRQLDLSSAIWKFRPIRVSGLDKQYLSRHPKLLPHLYFEDYEYSVYIDANIQIIGDEFYNEILREIEDNTLWAAPVHPARNCIYDEGRVAVQSLKAKYFKVRRYLKKVNRIGFPCNWGMTENNILLRKHNHESVQSIDKQWWQLFVDSKTRRDQLSLPVVFWKNNFYPKFLYEGKKTWEHKGLSRRAHPEKSDLVKTRFKDLRMRIYFRLFGTFPFK